MVYDINDRLSINTDVPSGYSKNLTLEDEVQLLMFYVLSMVNRLYVIAHQQTYLDNYHSDSISAGGCRSIVGSLYSDTPTRDHNVLARFGEMS